MGQGAPGDPSPGAWLVGMDQVGVPVGLMTVPSQYEQFPPQHSCAPNYVGMGQGAEEDPDVHLGAVDLKGQLVPVASLPVPLAQPPSHIELPTRLLHDVASSLAVHGGQKCGRRTWDVAQQGRLALVCLITPP